MSDPFSLISRIHSGHRLNISFRRLRFCRPALVFYTQKYPTNTDENEIRRDAGFDGRDARATIHLSNRSSCRMPDDMTLFENLKIPAGSAP